jgi:hypothetical protein
VRCWNLIREKNLQVGLAFDKQLDAEFTGELQARLAQLGSLERSALAGSAPNTNALLLAGMYSHEVRAWQELTGRENDFAGLHGFYVSDHFRAMPYTSVKCNLTALLLTDKQPVKLGDPADINNAAALLPYSDLFVTDKRMKTLLLRRGFDRAYKTAVCYVGDTERIDRFFAGIDTT